MLDKPIRLLLGFALFTAACSSAADESEPESTVPVVETTVATVERVEPEEAPPETEPEPEPGTLIWVHGQEPADLHFDHPTNNLPITSWLRAPLLEGLFGVDGSTSFHPELLARDAEVRVDDDGTTTIDYTLRSDLEWSDGTPLTSADVAYTHGILTEGCEVEADGSIIDGGGPACVYFDTDRSGIDLVTDFSVRSDTGFTVTLANFFAGWRGLYDEVYAAHAFGQDAAAVNRNLVDWTGSGGVLPSSGPLVFDSWDRGISLRLIRNDRYHGSTHPDVTNDGPATVDAVRVDFVPNLEDRIAAIADGRAHLLMASPRPELESLVSTDGINTAAVIGPAYEHLGFNVLNRHLSKAAVREAVANAIDKSELIDEVFSPLFGAALPADGLGNVYWVATQPAYEDHQNRYAGNNVDAASSLLEGAGYVPRSDGVYAHPVDGRLRLRIGTTGGNALREQQQLVLQRQLERAGIELLIDNIDGGAYFGQRPFAEQALLASATAGVEGDATIWDITLFGRTGGPWPAGQSASFRVANANNPYGYANPEFDVRASECDVVFDDADRADCYNELDLFVSTLEKGEGGLFMVPLTQRPAFFAYRTDVLAQAGVPIDGIGGGPLATVVDHRLN